MKKLYVSFQIESSAKKRFSSYSKSGVYTVVVYLGILLSMMQFILNFENFGLIDFLYIVFFFAILILLKEILKLIIKSPIQTIKLDMGKIVVERENGKKESHNLEEIKTKFQQTKDITQLKLQFSNKNVISLSNKKLEWSAKDLHRLYDYMCYLDETLPEYKIQYPDTQLTSYWQSNLAGIGIALLWISILLISLYVNSSSMDNTFFYITGFVHLSFPIFLLIAFSRAFMIIELNKQILKLSYPLCSYLNKEYSLVKLQCVEGIAISKGNGHIVQLEMKIISETKVQNVSISPAQLRDLLYHLESKGVNTNF